MLRAQKARSQGVVGPEISFAEHLLMYLRRKGANVKKAGLLILIAMFAIPLRAQSAQDDADLKDAPVALLNSCLYDSPDTLKERNIVAERVRALWIDGRSKPVDKVLCAFSFEVSSSRLYV